MHRPQIDLEQGQIADLEARVKAHDVTRSDLIRDLIDWDLIDWRTAPSRRCMR
jgi:hypothetical protein